MNDTKLNDSKRKLLKSAAVGGGVVSLTALPSQWTKPIVASVMLPAHAEQSTNSLGSINNCPPEYTESFSKYNGGVDIEFTIDNGVLENGPPNLTYTGSTLSGSGTPKYDSTNTPGGCTDGSDYSGTFKASFSAANKTFKSNFSSDKYCGDAKILALNYDQSATFTGTTDLGDGRIVRHYTGPKYGTTEACSLLNPEMAESRIKARVAAKRSKL